MTAVAKMSQARRRALEILRDQPYIWPKRFAHLMWPDSPAWRRSYKCGPNGSHRGGAMYRAGGAYLGVLRRAGLVDGGWPHGFFLTRKGINALEGN